MLIFLMGSILISARLQAQVPSLRDLRDHRTPENEAVSIAMILDEMSSDHQSIR